MEIYSFFMLVSLIWIHKETVLERLKPFRIPILLFSIFVVWVWVQQLALPVSVIELVSPNSYALFKSAEVGYGMTISVDSTQTKTSLLKSVSYLCVFISCLLLITTPSRAKQVMLCFLLAGVWQATYGSFEALSGLSSSLVFDLPVKNIATGTFVYRNHYANFLVLCLSMSVGYLVSTLETRNLPTNRAMLRSILTTLLNGKALVRVCLAIMVIALVMSRSRMGNSSFFIAMTITGLLGLYLIKNKTRGLTFLIISMFVIDIFILSAWFGLDKVQERLVATSLEQESRDEVVRDALPLLGDFAVTGSGMGSFYGIFPSYQSENIRLFYDHAHNDYLQFAIEAGIPASALLFALVTMCLYFAIRAMRVRADSIMRGVAFGCTMAILSVAIHMTVDFPLQAPANATYFTTILALSLLCTKVKRESRRRRSKRHTAEGHLWL
ncbi:O-antigen ligase family protein [Alteromonas macleodii]|uniref:O-antigen ligase family protein n=1 Tax=Alteromonas macleodii TaxID=28108 RepID=UPI00364B6B68